MNGLEIIDKIYEYIKCNYCYECGTDGEFCNNCILGDIREFVSKLEKENQVENNNKQSCATCRFSCERFTVDTDKERLHELYGCLNTEICLESNQTESFYCSKWEKGEKQCISLSQK